MRIPNSLSEAFGSNFEKLLTEFSANENLIPDKNALTSQRYLSRSIAPHVKRLSQIFNRLEDDREKESALGRYWKKSSNHQNLKAAYFLYFMPSNLCRMASVCCELARLGFRWNGNTHLKGIEIGSGHASGVTGIGSAEDNLSINLPHKGSWTLIERDRSNLLLGARWSEAYFDFLGKPDWKIIPRHQRVDFSATTLFPKTAPKFNFWIMSFLLNELAESPGEIAEKLLNSWIHHLEMESLIIIVEPALKTQSRKLLSIRKTLIEKIGKMSDFKILLPCLGSQKCGALEKEEDWCHEQISWWRPSYFRVIDKLCKLDRKTLPFSYLVITKSKRSYSELLPKVFEETSNPFRLVSPSHRQGKDLECYLCSTYGKSKARIHKKELKNIQLDRGDIIAIDSSFIKKENQSMRLHKLKKIGCDEA